MYGLRWFVGVRFEVACGCGLRWLVGVRFEVVCGCAV